MGMDITTLKVFNSLYDLNISQIEFKDIEREVGDKTKTGIYIAKVDNGKAICVSHDEDKHRITIEDSKGMGNKKIKVRATSRILFKTLITFKNVPEEIFALHRIAEYRARDTEIKFVAHNIEQLKDRVCQRYTDGYPKELGGEYDTVWDFAENRRKNKKKKPQTVINQLKAVYWLFGEEFTDEIEFSSRLNVARIVKVWQRKNMRIALFQENQCFEVNRGLCTIYQDVDRVTYRIKTYTPKDGRFNYVCPNREVGSTGNSDYIELWLDDDLFERVSPSELEIVQNLLGGRDEYGRGNSTSNDWDLITADKFNSLRREVRLQDRQRRRAKETEEAEETLQKNIKSQFRKGKVVRMGISFSPNRFSYEGITVRGDSLKEYIVKQNIVLLEQPNFNDILHGYIEKILDIKTDYNYYPESREVCFMIGEKNFQVGKVKIKVIAESRRITVNDFRIAKDELEDVLKRVINYDTQEQFDKFLENTQKVSLRLQKVLDRGFFQFPVKMDKTDDCCIAMLDNEILLAIPIQREGNKNYLVVDKEKYPVKNVNSLFKLQYPDKRFMYHYEGSFLQRIIVQLNKAVRDIPPEKIGVLIADGVADYKKLMAEERRIKADKVAKSQEFVENAVRLTKAKRIKGGYIVKGISGTVYTVNSKSQAVHIQEKNKPEKYLCIVDVESDEENEWGKNDILAKRLLMLSQDLKVAKEIFTRGDGMDKHWMEIIHDHEEATA